jgi:aminoglycoside 6'-N-acetyltransferase I
VKVGKVTPRDAPAWERMRGALWPGEHVREVAAFFAGDRHNPAEVLIANGDDGTPLGFAEVSVRNYAEGCQPGRVAYLEGLYVEPDARRTGVAAALVAAAEAWGREQGCTEFASDTGPDNLVSQAVHLALGFEEADRTVCYRKDLK